MKGGKKGKKRESHSLPGFTNSSQQSNQISACVLFLIPIRLDTKGEFGELAKLFEEGIANSGV